jgi:NhaP-type Na+/H+ and K+/H+ antiporter
MKRLALQTIVPVVAILLLSILLGWLIASSGTSSAGLRDAAVIVLAVFSLVGSLIAAAIFFAGAWAIGRFGQKGVTAVNWVGRKVLMVETKAQSITERAAVRPVARAARLLTTGKSFARAALRVDAD